MSETINILFMCLDRNTKKTELLNLSHRYLVSLCALKNKDH